MKNIFKPADIQGGMYIIRETSPKDSKNLGFAATVAFKIGWNAHVNGEYGLISHFTDGMYMKYGTKEELCEKLNNDVAGYRPLTKQEYLKILKNTDQGFYP